MDRSPATPSAPEPSLDAIASDTAMLAAPEAAAVLAPLPDADLATVLRALGPSLAEDVLIALGEDRRRAVLAAAPPDEGRQWARNLTCPDDSVGRIMEPPYAVFRPGLAVAEAVEHIRDLVRTRFVTYGFVTDEGGGLLGVVTMRDLLLAGRGDPLETVMLRQPFSLRPEMPLLEAARLAVARHFPVYPVCDAGGRLVGIVRGRTLFEEQALEISAQPGTMVGVEKEERLSTRGRAASASATPGCSSTSSPLSWRLRSSASSRARSTGWWFSPCSCPSSPASRATRDARPSR